MPAAPTHHLPQQKKCNDTYSSTIRLKGQSYQFESQLKYKSGSPFVFAQTGMSTCQHSATSAFIAQTGMSTCQNFKLTALKLRPACRPVKPNYRTLRLSLCQHHPSTQFLNLVLANHHRRVRCMRAGNAWQGLADLMHPVISASAVQVAKYDRATFRLPFLWFWVLQDVSHLPGIHFSVLADHTWNIGAVEATKSRSPLHLGVARPWLAHDRRSDESRREYK